MEINGTNMCILTGVYTFFPECLFWVYVIRIIMELVVVDVVYVLKLDSQQICLILLWIANTSPITCVAGNLFPWNLLVKFPKQQKQIYFKMRRFFNMSS